jgi:hypothetical protein
MAGPSLTPEQIEETRLSLERHGGNVSKVARELGLTRSTIQNRVNRVRAASSWENARTPVEKPKYRGVPWSWQQKSETLPSGNLHTSVDLCPPSPSGFLGKDQSADEPDAAIRVCVIGDLHVSPGQDLNRIRWIARHIKETKPDHIVQIGDWASFDSVSQHDPIGSIKARHRPSLRQDLECLHESLGVFDSELGPSTIPRLITLGNHEQRVARYEELRSELEDSLWLQVLQSFAQFRWKTFDYGQVAFIGGVGFTHVPFNRIGKPHSSPNIMANNLAHDLVKGHSHVATYLTLPKIGEGQGVTLIDVGTSLPHGHIEPYAKLSQTGWFWGVHDVIIRNGRIDDFARISMKSLEARYA